MWLAPEPGQPRPTPRVGAISRMADYWVSPERRRFILGMQALESNALTIGCVLKRNIVKTGPQNRHKALYAQYPISIAPSR
jgi:hypothetical protein